MEKDTEYYAKSKNAQGHRESVGEHLQKVADLAGEYGAPPGMETAARLAGQVHDFGKYSRTFQDVLRGLRTGVDHAMGGAWYLEKHYGKSRGAHPVIEAVYGHHDGLVSYCRIQKDFRKISDRVRGKTPSIGGAEQLTEAAAAFRRDFPDFRFPCLLAPPDEPKLESMLYTRMLFSCLVDADYTASALNDDSTYLENAEDARFDPQALLEKLYAVRDGIRRGSTADKTLNAYRDQVFERCGSMGEEAEGLYTLTAPTGTGKTLALLHFALRHCRAHGKKRIIVVLPFLTLAEQSVRAYREVVPNILVDHSQSDLPETARELAARWSAPLVVTTSVRFFEALFSDRPTVCRKLHNIADSVVLFDEAQSLPAALSSATVRAVNELCGRYHATVVFSTATQPDFAALKDAAWSPREILPENRAMFEALRRVETEWRIGAETPLETVAEEMSARGSVCAIVNLRRHARQLAEALLLRCPPETAFFLTTDLCPAHRSKRIETVRRRLEQGLPCRVVATQCIEAGVDLDFDTMYRALAPLEAIVQAAGRCNRNGRRAAGSMTVFCPQDSRGLYPDTWYKNAAVVVKEMKPPFSIHDPERIRDYYGRLFGDTPFKRDLKNAIDGRNFEKTAKEYRLIADAGVQIIVPYAGERELYERIAGQLREEGVTGALLREAAPITVTSFAGNLETYAEEIPFACRDRKRYAGAETGSRVYLLRPQYEELYSEQMGLHIPHEEESKTLNY